MASFLKKIQHYIQAMRLKTLLVSFSIWITGTGLSIAQQESINIILNAMILVCMVCLQIAVNYFNDALDFKRNKDTSQRLGPSRMVHLGNISYVSMIKSACFVLSFALICGVYLIYQGGWPIFVIGIVSLLSVYFYSSPPIALADRGLSEIFVFLFFGLLPVAGICYLNTLESLDIFSEWSWIKQFFYVHASIIKNTSSIVAGIQMGFLSISLLLVNHLRDQEEDFKTGKKTWVVRKGRDFGLIELACSIFIPYILGYYWLIVQNNELAFTLPLCVLPFHIYIFYKISQEPPSKKYNFYLALTSFGQLLFSTALVLGWMGF